MLSNLIGVLWFPKCCVCGGRVRSREYLDVCSFRCWQREQDKRVVRFQVGLERLKEVDDVCEVES